MVVGTENVPDATGCSTGLHMLWQFDAVVLIAIKGPPAHVKSFTGAECAAAW